MDTQHANQALDDHFTALRQEAVRLRGVGLVTIAGERRPVAIVDPAQRPELQDLAGVHRREGGGDLTLTWHHDLRSDGTGNSFAVIEVERPVRIRLVLGFTVPLLLPFLLQVAAARQLVLTTDQQLQSDALAIDVDMADLATTLTAWRAGRAVAEPSES